jgi:hypothetical protein
LPLPSSGDLLYGTAFQTITESQAGISFKLTHQLAKVILIADASYNNWTISTISPTNQITVGPHAPHATISYETDKIDPGSSDNDNRPVLWTKFSTAVPVSTVTSDTVTLSPGNGVLKVTIPKDALKISTGKWVPETTLTFPSKELTSGHSYKLRIKIKIPIFAKSNIYWDGSQLRFDETGNNDGYQGVFFKWGSLVGISPSVDWEETSTTLYVPPVKSSNKWYITTSDDLSYDATYEGDYLPHSSDWSGSDYASIPYVADDVTSLSTTNFDPTGLKGDICKYINPDWRMPNVAEFASSGNYSNISFGRGSVSSFKTTGNNPASYGTNSVGAVPLGIIQTATSAFFPAAGRRYYGTIKEDAGKLNFVGEIGYYWSGSSSETGIEEAYFLSFISGRVSPNVSDNRQCGFPVRCVKN